MGGDVGVRVGEGSGVGKGSETLWQKLMVESQPVA